mmetsp:Transcript_23331/g.57415  ORF Transcript_23331/g.57415 Transcript_23331/m.57415 type:complete len:1181 (-) Transcript_23331:2070-5612(-)
MTNASRSKTTPIVEDESDDVLTPMEKRGSGTSFKPLVSNSASFVAKKIEINGRKEKSSEEQYLLEKIALAEERFREIQKQHHEDRTVWRADRLKLERLRKKLKKQEQSQRQKVGSASKSRELQSAGHETGEESSKPLVQSAKDEHDDNSSVEEQVHNRQVMRLARQQELVACHAEEVLELRQSLYDLQTEHNITLAQMKRQAQALAAGGGGNNSYTKNLQVELDNWQSLYYESCEQGNRKIRALEEEIETLAKQQQEQQEQAEKQKKESENYFSKVKLEVTQRELQKTRSQKEKIEMALAEAKAQLESKSQEWRAQHDEAEPGLEEKAKKDVETQKESPEETERERIKLLEEQKKLEQRLQEMQEENTRLQETAEKLEKELHERIKLPSSGTGEEIHPGQRSLSLPQSQDGTANESDGPRQSKPEHQLQEKEDLLEQMDKDNEKLDNLQQERKEIEQKLKASDQKSFDLASELAKAKGQIIEAQEDSTLETPKGEQLRSLPTNVTHDNDDQSTAKRNDIEPKVQDLLHQIDASDKHTKDLESQLEAIQDKFEALSREHAALQQNAKTREMDLKSQQEEEKIITHDLRASLESKQAESDKVIQEKEKLQRQLRDLTLSLERESNRMKNELSNLQNEFDKLKEESATWETKANVQDKAYQETQKDLAKQKEEGFRLQRELDDSKRLMETRIEEIERKHSAQKLLSHTSKQHMKDLEWQLTVMKGEKQRSMSYHRPDDSKGKEDKLLKKLTEEQAKTKELSASAETARLEANTAIEERKVLEGKVEEMTVEMKRESSRLTGELKAAEDALSTLRAEKDSWEQKASAQSQESEKLAKLLQEKERELEKVSHRLEDSSTLVTQNSKDMEQKNAAKDREIEQLQEELTTKTQELADTKLQYDNEQDALLRRIEQAEQDVDEIEKVLERILKESGAQIEDLKQNLAQERENADWVGNEADELRRELDLTRHNLHEAENALLSTEPLQSTIEELRSDNELTETKVYRSELASQTAKTEKALEEASKAKKELSEIKQHLDESSLAGHRNIQNSSETIEELKGADDVSHDELLKLRQLLVEKDQRLASLEKELQEAKESQNNNTPSEDETARAMESALLEMQNGGDFITAAEKYETVAGECGTKQEAGIDFLLSAVSSSQDEIEALRLQIETGGMFETAALANLNTNGAP